MIDLKQEEHPAKHGPDDQGGDNGCDFSFGVKGFPFLEPQCGQVCEFAKGRIHRRGQLVGIGRLVYLDIAVHIWFSCLYFFVGDFVGLRLLTGVEVHRLCLNGLWGIGLIRVRLDWRGRCFAAFCAEGKSFAHFGSAVIAVFHLLGLTLIR